MDIRMDLSPGIDAEILTEYLDHQSPAVKASPGSPGGRGKVQLLYPGFQLIQVLLLVLLDDGRPNGTVAKTDSRARVQSGAVRDASSSLEHRTGKRQTCLFPAVAAVGLVENLKHLHGMFRLGHMASISLLRISDCCPIDEHPVGPVKGFCRRHDFGI